MHEGCTAGAHKPNTELLRRIGVAVGALVAVHGTPLAVAAERPFRVVRIADLPSSGLPADGCGGTWLNGYELAGAELFPGSVRGVAGDSRLGTDLRFFFGDEGQIFGTHAAPSRCVDQSAPDAAQWDHPIVEASVWTHSSSGTWARQALPAGVAEGDGTIITSTHQSGAWGGAVVSPDSIVCEQGLAFDRWAFMRPLIVRPPLGAGEPVVPLTWSESPGCIEAMGPGSSMLAVGAGWRWCVPSEHGPQACTPLGQGSVVFPMSWKWGSADGTSPADQDELTRMCAPHAGHAQFQRGTAHAVRPACSADGGSGPWVITGWSMCGDCVISSSTVCDSFPEVQQYVAASWRWDGTSVTLDDEVRPTMAGLPGDPSGPAPGMRMIAAAQGAQAGSGVFQSEDHLVQCAREHAFVLAEAVGAHGREVQWMDLHAALPDGTEYEGVASTGSAPSTLPPEPREAQWPHSRVARIRKVFGDCGCPSDDEACSRWSAVGARMPEGPCDPLRIPQVPPMDPGVPAGVFWLSRPAESEVDRIEWCGVHADDAVVEVPTATVGKDTVALLRIRAVHDVSHSGAMVAIAFLEQAPPEAEVEHAEGWTVGTGGNLASGAMLVLLTPRADLNSDTVVNGIDLGILMGNWGGTAVGPSGGDFNDDGFVDGQDFGVLLGHWTPPVGQGISIPGWESSECWETVPVLEAAEHAVELLGFTGLEQFGEVGRMIGPGGFTPFVAIASELTQDIIAEGP